MVYDQETEGVLGHGLDGEEKLAQEDVYPLGINQRFRCGEDGRVRLTLWTRAGYSEVRVSECGSNGLATQRSDPEPATKQDEGAVQRASRLPPQDVYDQFEENTPGRLTFEKYMRGVLKYLLDMGWMMEGIDHGRVDRLRAVLQRRWDETQQLDEDDC